MPIWLGVFVAGAAGGAVVILLPAGTDVPVPAILKPIFDRFPVPSHLIRNMILGAVASFAVWALANPEATFGQTTQVPNQFALSVIIGGAGGTIVNNLVRQAQRNEALTKTISDLNEVIEKLKPK